MTCTASNLALIAKAVIQAGGRTRWCVRTNRYDIDRKHTGRNKDGIHRENIYMCIGREVEDGAHCLGVVWSTAKTTLGELVLDRDDIVAQGNSWQSRR